MRPTLACLPLVLLLGGCDPLATPDTMLDEYVRRVGRVLEVDVTLRPVPAAPELPRRRERVLPTVAQSVGLLDFLGLYGCELQHIVGERNSGLGRVMHPASALDYELRFIVAAETCAAQMQRESLRKVVREVARLKRDDLPVVIWNATWGTQEIETLFTRSRGLLPADGARDQVAQVAADLEVLRDTIERIRAGDHAVGFTNMDSVLQRWLSSPVFGQSLRSAMALTVRLEDAAMLVERRLGDRPLCHRGHRNRKADTARSMFLTVYIGHVQPFMAALQRTRGQLLPGVQTLVPDDVPMSEAMQVYVRQVVLEYGEDSVWHALDLATRRHTRAWQALLAQCGMTPGQQEGIGQT